MISQLKIAFNVDSILDRKRVLNMYLYQIMKRVLRKYPKKVMTKPRFVIRLINAYTYADVKSPLPHPPLVSNSLSNRQIYAVNALRRLV